MARAHFVNKARKDYPAAGIKKGESYWWWKFKGERSRRMSKTKPRRSALTRSEFYANLYDIQDTVEAIEGTSGSAEIIKAEIDSIVERLEELRDECQERLDNMPEELQETSSSGMLLQERVEALDGAISEFESIDTITEEMSEDEARDAVSDETGIEPSDITDAEIADHIADHKSGQIEAILDEVRDVDLFIS